MNFEIFDYYAVKPLQCFGLTGKFWTLHLDTLIYTWVAMIVFFSLAYIGRLSLRGESNKISVCSALIVRFFMTTTKDTIGHFEFSHFAFITNIFFFTFFCCIVGVLPFLDEATKDLNTTLALGLSSFCYVQYHKIRAHGILGYLKEFLHPFFLMLPVNVIGELAKIASMSFRLFGNILGGGIVFMMVVNFLEGYALVFLGLGIAYLIIHQIFSHLGTIPTTGFWGITLKMLSVAIFFLAWAQLFFGVLEGLIQSFVLMMLTLTYLAMGIQSHDKPTQTPAGTP